MSWLHLVDGPSVAEFRIYQDVNRVGTAGGGERAFVVHGLQAGMLYCFSVTSVSEAGESAPSNPVCGTA